MLAPPDKPYYQQSLTDRTINRLINSEEEITQEVLHQVYTASEVEAGIEVFRKIQDSKGLTSKMVVGYQ